MRICHFSDSHLGAGESHRRRAPSGLTERQEDIIAAFVEAVDRIIELRPDYCIHSGDLFDSVRPYNSIMARAGRELHRLAAEAGIPTILIAGNHDAPRQPHVGAAVEVFKQIRNLFVAASGRLEKFRLGEVCFHALPHCLTTSELKKQLALCLPDSDARYNVLVMHGVAAGMPEFSMADLGEQELPLDVMQRFNYTALGHYHNFCQVGPRAWYAGSTERLSQAEREVAKGFAVVDLEPFNVEFLPVHSRGMVDLSEIDASGKRGDEVAQLLKARLDEVGVGDKIVRVRIANVSEETLKTLPAGVLAELKQSAYSLDVRFEKSAIEGETARFGRSAVGRLDQSFIHFLEACDLQGFDKERIVNEALRYLSAGEQAL
ncbi:MAG: DNA repair exonuclease [Candidatus Zixiibacteriota bacterium]